MIEVDLNNGMYRQIDLNKPCFCSECKKKIRQDITDDLLQYERQKVIEWVRKKKDKVK